MARNLPSRIGGSFAPKLDDSKLVEYSEIALSADDKTSDMMKKLIEMVSVFNQTPYSKLQGTKHDSGMGMVVPLEDAEVERIWDYVPWKEECEMMSKVFENLPNGLLRNAAFHLLWYANELCQDREPMTMDRLGI